MHVCLPVRCSSSRGVLVRSVPTYAPTRRGVDKVLARSARRGTCCTRLPWPTPSRHNPHSPLLSDWRKCLDLGSAGVTQIQTRLPHRDRFSSHMLAFTWRSFHPSSLPAQSPSVPAHNSYAISAGLEKSPPSFPANGAAQGPPWYWLQAWGVSHVSALRMKISSAGFAMEPGGNMPATLADGCGLTMTAVHSHVMHGHSPECTSSSSGLLYWSHTQLLLVYCPAHQRLTCCKPRTSSEWPGCQSLPWW